MYVAKVYVNLRRQLYITLSLWIRIHSLVLLPVLDWFPCVWLCLPAGANLIVNADTHTHWCSGKVGGQG